MSTTKPVPSLLNRRLLSAAVCIGLLAALSALAAIRSQGGFERVPTGDAAQYIGVARSLATGTGYTWPISFWGSAPHLGRLPLWPAFLAVVTHILPHASDGNVLRFSGILVHALSAFLLVLLAFRLWPDIRIAGLAGIFFALYPPALALLDAGYSEGIFVLFAIGGMILLLLPQPAPLFAAFVLGCSVLARSNVIVLPFLMLGGALLYNRKLLRFWKYGLLLTILFLLPAIAWLLRNFAVAGVFPMLTSVEGETLYGGNNALVADDLRYWGYWVFPDIIPGEASKRELAKHMSEAQVNKYYFHQGVAFIKNHLRDYPRLELGKLIRGFIPVPWVPNTSSLLASATRLLLYALFIWAWAVGFRSDVRFTLFLWGLLLATLITTVVFYGTFRFTFCLEPFLMPPVALQLVRFWDMRRTRRLTPSASSVV